MKEGWVTKKLGEVCEKTGTINPLTQPEVEFRYIDISSVCNASFSIQETTWIKGKEAPSRARKLIYFGDVLFATVRPTLLRVAIVPQYLDRNICSTGFFVARPNQNFEGRLLFYYLISPSFLKEISKLERGASYPAVTDSDIREQKISFPVNKAEQQRIATILDAAFADLAQAKANAQKNLANAKELFASELNTIFTRKGEGWVTKKLGEVASVSYGYTDSASSQKKGPKFLRITDIQDNCVKWDDVPYCTIDAKSLSKFKLKDGDIVFARTGASTGKSYLVTNPPEAVFASYLIRVQLNTNFIVPEFLSLYFLTKKYWDHIETGISGSAQGGFNATKLAELLIPFPHVQNQQRIVSRFNELSEHSKKLEAVYTQKLSLYNEMKQSLLQKAFSGEL